MREIGEKAFYECKQLKNAQLNEGLTKLGQDVFASSTIENVLIPSTLKDLGYETFDSCKSLRSVKIPRGVERIGKWCFYASGIEEISLPSTLREVVEGAFNKCSALKTICVEEGCKADVKSIVGDSVNVLQVRQMVIGG